MVSFTFDYSKLPIIKVVFEGKITGKNVESFFKKWVQNYKSDKNHTLIMDITKLEAPSIKCSMKLARCAKKQKILTKDDPLYLQRTIIIMTENKPLRYIIKIVAKITAPEAPLFIYWKKKAEQNITVDTIHDVYYDNIMKFQYIRPEL